MENNMLDKIGLIIRSCNSTAKCISIIRKYNKISMADIKNAIDNEYFVLSCDYTDDSGIRKVRRCYDELTKIGAVVDIYEDGVLSSREFISNLIDTYREIEEETQTMIDAEVADEEDDNVID